jgi:hypothetical protein
MEEDGAGWTPYLPEKRRTTEKSPLIMNATNSDIAKAMAYMMIACVIAVFMGLVHPCERVL